MAQKLKDTDFHYTPEIARIKAKEAFNWRDYIQPYIDKYVDIAVKDAKFTTYVEIPKPERFDYDETREHVLEAAKALWPKQLEAMKAYKQALFARIRDLMDNDND